MKTELIAPCGMNCNLCMAYLRKKDRCLGCDKTTRTSCQHCKIRWCEKREGLFCFECNEFPCKNLESLDKRYREKYEMSEIDNLRFIKEYGLEKFIESEELKWVDEDGVYCVHNKLKYKKD